MFFGILSFIEIAASNKNCGSPVIFHDRLPQTLYSVFKKRFYKKICCRPFRPFDVPKVDSKNNSSG